MIITNYIGDASYWQRQSRAAYQIARDLRCEERIDPPRSNFSASEVQQIAWSKSLVARGLLLGKSWHEIITALDAASNEFTAYW